MSEYYDLGKLKFVVVDDSDHWRSILRILLSALEVKEMDMYGDAATALKDLRSLPADIVICDWEMPDMSGVELLRQLRDENTSPNPFIPLIMLTAHTQKHRVEEARDAGATEVLTKPVSAQTLYEHIIGIIANPRRFIRVGAYFGPERRRHEGEPYLGEERRAENIVDGSTTKESEVADLLTKVRESRRT